MINMNDIIMKQKFIIIILIIIKIIETNISIHILNITPRSSHQTDTSHRLW